MESGMGRSRGSITGDFGRGICQYSMGVCTSSTETELVSSSVRTRDSIGAVSDSNDASEYLRERDEVESFSWTMRVSRCAVRDCGGGKRLDRRARTPLTASPANAGRLTTRLRDDDNDEPATEGWSDELASWNEAASEEEVASEVVREWDQVLLLSSRECLIMPARGTERATRVSMLWPERVETGRVTGWGWPGTRRRGEEGSSWALGPWSWCLWPRTEIELIRLLRPLTIRLTPLSCMSFSGDGGA